MWNEKDQDHLALLVRVARTLVRRVRLPAAHATEDTRLKARIHALTQSLIDDGKVAGQAIGDIMESLL